MSRAKYEAAIRRTSVGTQLAARSVNRMPNRTPQERVARANALMAGLRVMRMGEWRPVFPFFPPKDSP